MRFPAYFVSCVMAGGGKPVACCARWLAARKRLLAWYSRTSIQRYSQLSRRMLRSTRQCYSCVYRILQIQIFYTTNCRKTSKTQWKSMFTSQCNLLEPLVYPVMCAHETFIVLDCCLAARTPTMCVWLCSCHRMDGEAKAAWVLILALDTYIGCRQNVALLLVDQVVRFEWNNCSIGLGRVDGFIGAEGGCIATNSPFGTNNVSNDQNESDQNLQTGNSSFNML